MPSKRGRDRTGIRPGDFDGCILVPLGQNDLEATNEVRNPSYGGTVAMVQVTQQIWPD